MRSVLPFILQTIVWIPTRIVLAFFVSLKIEGAENLNGLKQVIFAPNHSSELDPILLPASLNPFSRQMPMFYVSRERSFYKKRGLRAFFYGGIWFKMWGAYEARSGLKNYERSLETHISLLNAGSTICMFPEGFKTRDGKLQEPRGGVAFLSAKTKVPVVPVALHGHYRMSKKDFFRKKRTIRITFGTPVYVHTQIDTDQSLDPHHYKDISKSLIMSQIRDMLASTKDNC